MKRQYQATNTLDLYQWITIEPATYNNPGYNENNKDNDTDNNDDYNNNINNNNDDDNDDNNNDNNNNDNVKTTTATTNDDDDDNNNNNNDINYSNANNNNNCNNSNDNETIKITLMMAWKPSLVAHQQPGCKNIATVFPACIKRWIRVMEQGGWGASHLFCFFLI